MSPEPKIIKVVLGSAYFENMNMSSTTSTQLHPAILNVLRILQTIDHLSLPASSRRDIESMLVRLVTRVLGDAFCWQQGHGERTAALAFTIGKVAGLSSGELHHLTLAALLHDIGLSAVTPEYLQTIPDWNDESYVATQCHPRLGAELLEPFRFLREASVIIAHHHERWDGAGYPYGIRGPLIPVPARILAIADAFDSIRIPRATAAETRALVAYRILRVSAGTQFDPELVELCGACLARTGSESLSHSVHFCKNHLVRSAFHEESP